MVRFLALPWVGALRLVEHPLGERTPDRALCLLLHQGAESQVCRKNVCLCTGVADIPEQEKNTHTHTVTSNLHRDKLRKNALENVTLLINSSIKCLKHTTLPDGAFLCTKIGTTLRRYNNPVNKKYI